MRHEPRLLFWGMKECILRLLFPHGFVKLRSVVKSAASFKRLCMTHSAPEFVGVCLIEMRMEARGTLCLDDDTNVA